MKNIKMFYNCVLCHIILYHPTMHYVSSRETKLVFAVIACLRHMVLYKYVLLIY